MANILTSRIYKIDTTGILLERSDKAATDPIKVKTILLDGSGGSVTFKDNQSTPASEFTLSCTASQSAILPFGSAGNVFPKGLQVTALTAGCTVTMFLS